MERRPLEGKRIVVTRPAEQAGGLVERLEALGAEAVVCPAIRIVPPVDLGPLDRAIEHLGEYDWLIVTSVNGVQALVSRMAQLGIATERLRRPKIGAIGPATAEALARHHLEPQFVPSAYVAEAIVAEIGELGGQRVLLPRAAIAREALARGLRGRGALVDEVPAYQTLPAPENNALAGLLRQGAVDAVTFTSSSTVRYLLEGLEAEGLERETALALLGQAAIVCIGPVTAETARQEGLRVDSVAAQYTADGVAAALAAWFGAAHLRTNASER